MFDLLLQLFGLILLLAGLWLGYRRWVQPYQTSLDAQARGLLLLLVLAGMGGAIGSPFWWIDDVRSFAWDVPPLASRMLAAASASFVVVCLMALEKPTYQRVRLVLILLTVYLLPLGVAIVLFHLDRFDPANPLTYAFFIIVILLVAAALWYLFRQPLIHAGDHNAAVAISPAVRGWLVLVAMISGLWGLALFVTDNGPYSLIWVWPGDLLSSRLIGVMMVAIAAAAVYSLRSAGAARPLLALILTYGLGVAAASLWNLSAGRSVPFLYLAIFGFMAFLSAVLLFSEVIIADGPPQ